MAEESLVEGEDENILYDLLVISEWPPEADLQVTVPWCFDIYFLIVAHIHRLWTVCYDQTRVAVIRSHVAETRRLSCV